MNKIKNHTKEDFSRIKNNSIVLVVFLGISLIPCLYAWFNIAASWDPYKHTENIPMAVVNEDKGYEPTLIPKTFDIGEKLKMNLAVEETVNWIFTDREDAVEGVKSGTYYAAIIIPADFSEKMFSFLSPGGEAPELEYYVNEKKNAIAPKVVGKEAGNLTDWVKETFTKTLYDTVFDSLLTFKEDGENARTDALWDQLQQQLGQSSDALSVQAATLRSFKQLAEASKVVMKSGDNLMDTSKSALDENMGRMKEDRKDLNELKSTLNVFRRNMETALDKNIAYMEKLGGDVDDLFEDGEAKRDRFVANRRAVISTLEQDIKDKEEMVRKITDLNDELPIPLMGLERAAEKICRSKGYEEAMLKDLKAVDDGEAEAYEDIAALRREFLDSKERNQENLDALRREINETMFVRLDSVQNQLDGVGKDTEKLWADARQSAKEVARLSARLQGNLSDLSNHMDRSIELIDGAKQSVDDLYDKTVVLENSEGVDKIKLFLSEDTKQLSQFLAKPMQTRIHHIFAVENYGSAMAAFYTTLALWVGAVVQVALIDVKTPASYEEKYGEFKPHEQYLGRLSLFLIIATIQSLLIALGDLYFLDIQCLHPAHFLFTTWVASMVFTMVIYTLTVSFGDIGKAICVVLMVIQVAGSGGTFPIDVAPKFFRTMYPFLPFVYSMNAMKETIAGFYGATYTRSLWILQIYLIGSLVLGLVLRKPIVKLNDRFMERLEETKIM